MSKSELPPLGNGDREAARQAEIWNTTDLPQRLSILKENTPFRRLYIRRLKTVNNNEDLWLLRSVSTLVVSPPYL